MDGDGHAIPLSRLRGSRMAGGGTDLRSWDVYSADGRRIGDVYEVLVDTATMQVRYLDVEVENVVATGRERHVLIPVALARRDPALRRAVVVAGLAARAVRALPSYARGTAVRGAHPAVARPRYDVEPNPAHEPLDLPLRVEPPLVIRPIRLPAREPANPAVETVPAPASRADPGSRRAFARESAGAGPRAA